MSSREPSVETAGELGTELTALLRNAHENGIDVEGGWVCRHEDDLPDWDVVVTEVEKHAESERSQSTGESQSVED